MRPIAPLLAIALNLLLVIGGQPLDAAVVKVACVGDSITAGAGASGGSTTYPAVLATLLGGGYTVSNFGRSGATLLKNGDLPYWTQPEFTASDTFAPDVVVIMLGTNDSKSQNWQYETQFAGDYGDLIDHYRALPSHPLVFCCTVCPVFNSGNFGITSPVVQGEVIPLIVQVATAKGAPLIDVNAALGGLPADFPDNVHPNDAGYVVLAQTVYRPIHPPTAASGLSATAVGASRIDLAWSQTSDNETGFAVERRTGAGSFAVIATAAANATSFSDTTVAAATTYTYRVRAVNDAGSATPTSDTSASTPAASSSSGNSDNSGHCGAGGGLGALLALALMMALVPGSRR